MADPATAATVLVTVLRAPFDKPPSSCPRVPGGVTCKNGVGLCGSHAVANTTNALKTFRLRWVPRPLNRLHVTESSQCAGLSVP